MILVVVIVLNPLRALVMHYISARGTLRYFDIVILIHIYSSPLELS